jgi:hypothetical protein
VVGNRNTFTGLNNSDEKGMLIYDSSDNKVYFWNGSVWVEAGGGVGLNQTLTLNGNTFTLTGAPSSTVALSSGTPQTGQVLVWNGTTWTSASIAGDITGNATTAVVSGIKGKALPSTLPSTTNALVYDGTAWAFQPLSAGGGEANTASNAGSAGVGVFKQKAAQNLEFKNINAASNRIAITNDVANSEVDIDVNQLNLSIASTQVTGLGGLAILSAIGSAQITDGAITGTDIATATITGANIANTTITSDKLAQSGANLNQVMQWNGTNWIPANASGSGTVTTVNSGTGLTGGPITTTGTIGIAPGGVTATELATNAVSTINVQDNAITSAKIADGVVTGTDIAATTITGGNIANTTITANKLAQSAATLNQTLQWNGTNWVPANAGAGTVTTVNTGTGLTGGPISATGTIAIATGGVGTTELADNGVATVKIQDNAITSAKIFDGVVTGTDIAATTITNANIANTTITTAKFAQSGAALNNVIQWNGTNWVPAALTTGWGLTGNSGTTAGTSFIGTTDDEAFEIKVNNIRVLRYEINLDGSGLPQSPNIIGGYFANSAAAGVKGSVISGGGLDNFNSVDGDYATIGGGRDNHAGQLTPYNAYSTVGGGASNSARFQWSTIAGGRYNNANGNATAIPGGVRLIAAAFGSTVVGTANEDPTLLGYSTSAWVATDPVFIVGNGEVDGPGNPVTRSNAMEILKNGRIGIGRNPSANLLEVAGEASKTVAGGWIANSDRRIKTDIQEIDNSFEIMKKLRPVKFKYTTQWKTTHPTIKDQYYYNFIAQEYQQVFPESVQKSGEHLAGETDEILQIDTYNAQITTIKAVQELIYKMEKIEAENQQLKTKNASLETTLSSFQEQLGEIKAMLNMPKAKTTAE